MRLAAYTIMLIFDFSLLASGFYIVQYHNWSPHWFWLIGYIVFCSNPKHYLGDKS